MAVDNAKLKDSVKKLEDREALWAQKLKREKDSMSSLKVEITRDLINDNVSYFVLLV